MLPERLTMSFERKLSRLTSPGPRPAPARDVTAEGPPLPGQLRETPHGPVHVVERFLEPHHHHGHAPVRDALSVRSDIVARLALDVGLEGVDPRRMLLLDTETTGLAGGAGTIPFLLGLAWFEDESLCVRQLFLRRLGEEAPMLHDLAERLRWASCIVTYNGKSFDWPLVRTRYVLNRVPLPEPPPHLDLLHCARRVYRRRFPRLRLVDLEVELLGMEREQDVGGWEIPSIYLRWLREGDVGQLGRVIEHNAHDLVALAALLARIASRFESVGTGDDPRDHLSYAEVAARAGDEERARQFALAAAEGGGDAECTAHAWMLAARLARRRGATHDEEDMLHRAAESAEDEATGAHAHLRLAKLYEHRVKDFARALEHAAQTMPAEGDEAHERRVARLRRKLNRR